MTKPLKNTNIRPIGTKYKLLVLISFILVCISGLPSVAEGAGASLYFSPGSGTFFIGSTFDISIFINTGGNNVNAVKVDLKFDPKKLQIASPTAGKSFIAVWVAQPAYSNIEGTASFQGGVPSPGINTSSGLVSTITFRAISPGETSIYFADSSKVLLDDGKGTDILTSLGKGAYTLTIPPPEGPKIFSHTHPDQNKWYKNNTPNFSWEKAEMVNAFSYNMSRNYYDEPDNVSEGEHSSISFADLEDGIWYFSIKARQGELWGGISRYIVQIDKSAPASFELVFDPVLRSPVSVSKEPIIRFITTDALSGLEHYTLKHIDLTGKEKKEGFFVEVSSPYRMPELALGEHEIIIRAFDAAGNYQDSAEKIEVIPTEQLFYVSKNGINIFSIFISWWKLILILIIILILILICTFLWWRKNKRLERTKKYLIGVKGEAEKNREEIKRKLNGI